MRNKFNSVEPWRKYLKGITYQQMFNEYTPNFNITIVSFREIPFELQERYLAKGFSPALSINDRPYGELVCSVKITSPSFTPDPNSIDPDDIAF